IAMLNAYVGPDVFRDGVRRYMRAHAFGNTVDTDMWSVLQTVANKPILRIGRDFTRQEGLPLVCVSLTRQGLHLAELRFFADPAAAGASDAQHWAMPLSVWVPGGRPRQLLLEDTTNVPVRPPALVNAGQTAYARVLYPQAAFLALLNDTSSLAPVDRLGLMNDSLALGLAGYAPVGNAFAIAQELPPDADPIVWRRVTAMVTTLDRHYADTPARASFRAFARGLLSPVLARIGDEARGGEDANTAMLREDLTKTLGYLGDDAVIARARRNLKDGSGAAQQQRSAVEVAAEQADGTIFDLLLERARKSQDPLDKERLYEALGGVENPALALRMIAIALDSELPAGSNANVLSVLAENHPELVWSDAVPHLADPAVGMTKDEQWSLVAEVCARFADPARAAQVQAYVDRNVPADARRPFIGAIAAIHENARIAARVLPELDRWIARQEKR
ncbi:MAG TPA: M1 family metallopeptidase, partial [Rhizomicrobium sp.]